MLQSKSVRYKLARIIFRNDTKAGRVFDLLIMWMIILSVTIVIIDSDEKIGDRLHNFMQFVQWSFTVFFTIEYILRVYAAPNRRRYVTSFFGIVDLLAILPSYIGLFAIGKGHFLIVRILRLLRIFRIFQMDHFLREGSIVANALKASSTKITVFLVFVIIASVLLGAFMYMFEANHNSNLENIPDGIYWAIVTLTTVGYGDTIPVTTAGKILASIVMILGYGVIAVPIGIVTAEISSRVLTPRDRLQIKCIHCGSGEHLLKALYCNRCGSALPIKT